MSPEAVIHVLDLATADVSDLPGSQGLFNTGSSNDSFGVTVDFVVRELIPAVSP
jgi:hypothetical protein